MQKNVAWKPFLTINIDDNTHFVMINNNNKQY